MNNNKKKYIKVGTVMKKKDGTSNFLALGQSNPKNPKYNFTVEITIKDATGAVVGQTTNGILSIQNPRKRPGISEEQAARIPANILSEIFLITE